MRFVHSILAAAALLIGAPAAAATFLFEGFGSFEEAIQMPVGERFRVNVDFGGADTIDLSLYLYLETYEQNDLNPGGDGELVEYYFGHSGTYAEVPTFRFYAPSSIYVIREIRHLTFNAFFFIAGALPETSPYTIKIETYGAPVPEPATWSMLIVGFGLVGGALRVATRGRGSLSWNAARLTR